MCNNLLHDSGTVDSQCPFRNDRSERHRDKGWADPPRLSPRLNEEFWCQVGVNSADLADSDCSGQIGPAAESLVRCAPIEPQNANG
jgi:hypothetical protein